MLNVAIIGYGRWGPNYYRCFNNIDIARTHCVVDTDRAILDKLHDDIIYYDSIDVMLNDDNIDAVVIATPPSTHKDILLKLGGRFPVLCEKPLTDNYSNSLCIAQNSNIFMVGYLYIFNPFIREIKRIINSLG